LNYPRRRNGVSYVNVIRKKIFNLLGDTLIGNISSMDSSYVEDQWKLVNKKEVKIQTRTRSLDNVTTYMSKITSKKLKHRFQVYNEYTISSYFFESLVLD